MYICYPSALNNRNVKTQKTKLPLGLIGRFCSLQVFVFQLWLGRHHTTEMKPKVLLHWNVQGLAQFKDFFVQGFYFRGEVLSERVAAFHRHLRRFNLTSVH